MILIPASEVPDLMEALNEKLLSTQAEIATIRCPETIEALHEQCVRINRMIDRITLSYRAWNATDDAAWVGLIVTLVEEADEATTTAAGHSQVFTDLKIRLTEEMPT